MYKYILTFTGNDPTMNKNQPEDLFMKKASDILSDELEMIYLILDVLLGIQRKLMNRDDVPYTDIKQVIYFLRVFVENCHNKKEKSILFPELQKNAITISEGLLEQMRSEKELSGLYTVAMETIIKENKVLTAEARDKLIVLINKYLKLIREHIHKEQFYILPILQQELPEATQDKILEEFKLSDEEAFGYESNQKFHKSFSKVFSVLQEKYDNQGT